MCAGQNRVAIGGKTNAPWHFFYFNESSKYVTSNAGEYKVGFETVS